MLRQETVLSGPVHQRRSRRSHGARLRVLATSLSGTVLLHAEGQDFQLLERDALRFAADQPFWLENQFNGTARLLLTYRYLK